MNATFWLIHRNFWINPTTLFVFEFFFFLKIELINKTKKPHNFETFASLKDVRLSSFTTKFEKIKRNPLVEHLFTVQTIHNTLISCKLRFSKCDSLLFLSQNLHIMMTRPRKVYFCTGTDLDEDLTSFYLIYSCFQSIFPWRRDGDVPPPVNPPSGEITLKAKTHDWSVNPHYVTRKQHALLCVEYSHFERTFLLKLQYNRNMEGLVYLERTAHN